MSACAWMVDHLQKGLIATPLEKAPKNARYGPRVKRGGWIKKSTVDALKQIQKTPGEKIGALALAMGYEEGALRTMLYSIRKKKLIETKKTNERHALPIRRPTNSPVGFYITRAGVLALQEQEGKERPNE